MGDSLKDNPDFKAAVKGETGETGLQGKQGDSSPAGQDGASPSAKDVATQLLTGQNKGKLVGEVAGNESLQQSVADNQGLRKALATNLKEDGRFRDAVKDDRGETGPQDKKVSLVMYQQ